MSLLSLVNKHEDIHVSDLENALVVSLFVGKLVAGDIDGAFKLVLKHGDAIVGDMGKAELDIFDSDLVMGDAEKVDLVAKHSVIEIGDIGDAEMDLFDSSISIAAVAESLDLVAKHSKLKAVAIANGNWEMRKCGCRFTLMCNF